MGGRKNAQNPYKRYRVGQPSRLNPDWAGWIKGHRNTLVRVISWKDTTKFGPNVLLWWPGQLNAGKQLALNLCELTIPELEGLEKFIVDTIALAKPIAEARDEKARVEYDEGRDVDPRIYWRLPEVVIRPWSVGINPESILDGPPDDALRSVGDGDSDGRVRDSSGTVAESDEEAGLQAEDDPEALDELQDVRELGGPVDPPGLRYPDPPKAPPAPFA